ncbi:MAG: DUF4256 domain-containing protein [Chloroflexota bacterium]
MPSLPPDAQTALLDTLKARFEANPQRHDDMAWDDVLPRLTANPDALWSLSEMERTGGEPDVVGVDAATGEVLFYDCSAQSPIGRRSCCYDPQALASRKKNKPDHSAIGLAAVMGVEVLTADEYRHLQSLGAFDTTTSSWLKTPDAIREQGGAIFGDCRYDQVFVYHNGAESYYAARGVRCVLRA